MTQIELLETQMRDVGTQLDNAFKGMTEAGYDCKPSASAMTPREQLTHLGECYQAVVDQLEGKKHEWGTYKPVATEWSALQAEVMDLRTKAVAGVLKDGSDDALKAGSAFVVGHDNYHVGQLCICRMESDSGWDPYSIYEGLM